MMKTDKNIIRFSKISSTQDYAKKIAEKSQHGTIIVAEKQTNGRGQFERGWSSQKGGLYFSVILKPKIQPKDIPTLTFTMAEAIADIVKCEGYSVFIKPPNDVMIRENVEGRGEKDKKVAGILTESSIIKNRVEWVVIGVGINVNNRIPEYLKSTAISLKEITKKNLNIDDIFNRVIKNCSKKCIDFSESFCYS